MKCLWNLLQRQVVTMRRRIRIIRPVIPNAPRHVEIPAAVYIIQTKNDYPGIFGADRDPPQDFTGEAFGPVSDGVYHHKRAIS